MRGEPVARLRACSVGPFEFAAHPIHVIHVTATHVGCGGERERLLESSAAAAKLCLAERAPPLSKRGSRRGARSETTSDLSGDRRAVQALLPTLWVQSASLTPLHVVQPSSAPCRKFSR